MQELNNQDVLVMHVALHYVDVSEDLADTDLKLKFHMDGVTHLKTQVHKAKASRINFDTVGKTIYEGGYELNFQLCKPSRFFNSSHIVASSRLSLTEALESLELGGSVKEVSNLELLATDGSGKVLATLAFGISIESSALQAVGGTAALKTTTVPSEPSHSAFGNDHSDYRSFMLQSSVSRLRLQSALNSARAAIDSSQSRMRLSAKEAADGIDDMSTSCGSLSRL